MRQVKTVNRNCCETLAVIYFLSQAGILAAAGLQALDDFERGMLNKDHERAIAIAEKLAELPGLTVDVDVVDTNIILVS